MARFFVTWEIDILDAASPREAAQRAFDMVRKDDTTTTVFKVIEYDGSGEAETIDLLEGEI